MGLLCRHNHRFLDIMNYVAAINLFALLYNKDIYIVTQNRSSISRG